MADLDKALAAARDRLSQYEQTPDDSLEETMAGLDCIESLRDILAALDAARGEAVAWVDEFGNAYPLAAYNGKGDWLDDHKRHWRRAYLAPVAPAAAVPDGDIFEAYKSWPEDIRKKLSAHDLRRMAGWAPRTRIGDWAIDTSAGRPILTYKACSVIESEDARYVLSLLRRDAVKQTAAATLDADQIERDFERVISQREEREAVINDILDLVLGTDRSEWSSAYDFRDAVIEVEERMAALTRQQPSTPPPAGLDAARGKAVDQQFRWRPLGQTEFSDWTSKRAVTDGWVSRARAAGHDVEVRDVFAAPVAPAAAVPAANVTPMRQPRADLARLVESIKAAVYANGDGLSVTEAIGALELAKLELLKEQEQ